ncbi:MAG TPA: DUF167 domain-containing protein [Candidatus Binatia bacterium]|nr:DUF167 domain-containing protein [Candidatus Binatia bacterium]
MARRIAVIVKPKARKPEIVKISPDVYRIAVREPAQNGQANKAAIKFLSEHLGIPKSKLKIVRGVSSQHKLIEVMS